MPRPSTVLAASAVALLALVGCDLRGVAYAPDDVPAIIHQEFDPVGAGDSAVGVAHCESTLVPSAVSPGGGNWGLFQINRVHSDDFVAVTGRPWSDVLDPYWNAVYARHLYDQQGWRPWSCRWAA